MRIWLSIFLFALPLAAAGLRAGVARVDITPPVGHAMGGYSARKGNATGTHDPLSATVLVVESGGSKLAIVAADLRSFVSTRVGEIAKQRYGIDNTIISVSHTHSGPLTWEARTPWYTQAEDKMVEAIGQASKTLAPATLARRYSNVYLGFNRRKVENGTATMWWRNAEKLPSHPVDPELTVLVVRGAQTARRRRCSSTTACASLNPRSRQPRVLRRLSGHDAQSIGGSVPGVPWRFCARRRRRHESLPRQGTGAGRVSLPPPRRAKPWRRQ